MPQTQKRTQTKKPLLLLLILVMTGVCLTIAAVSLKKGMHVDEYYSFGLSNYTGSEIYMTVEPGKTYENPHEPFHAYMTVDSENRFNYENVFEKQAADVHPPVYYILLHTISSLFPNTFSIWFAAIINILFFIGTILLVYDTARQLSNCTITAFTAAALCACSGGLIQINTFLRMYTMLMFLIAALTWLHVKYYSKQTTLLFVLYPIICLVGMLTHYYFAIFLVLQGVYFGISLLLRKRIVSAGIYLGETILTAAGSIAIFPPMIEHIFFGYRGKETAQNLLESSGYTDGLMDFFHIISRNLTGMLLYGILLLFVLCYFCQCISKKDSDLTKCHTALWGMLWIPSILYYLLIAKIAVYHYDRYITPIYPVLVILIAGMITYSVKHLFKKQKSHSLLCAILCIGCILCSYIGCDWTYLMSDTKEDTAIAEQYQDYDCIVINNGDNFWSHTLYYEVENYHSLTFLFSSQMETYAQTSILHSEPIVVYIMDYVEDHNTVLDALITQNPAYSSAEHISDSAFAKMYLLQ